MDDKKRSKKVVITKPMWIGGGVLMALVLVLFLATSVIPKALVTLSQASSPGRVVPAGSYIIGDKILARADGVDVCTVNVFLLDRSGKGVAGQRVELTGIEGVKKINELSDKDGRVSFRLTSNKEGQFPIRANFNGAELPQTIVVTFRN
jgi:hypothetical protein